MENKKKNAFQYMYNKNPENGAYIVEVSLDDYSELFNGWDASPLKRRDLEPELLDYLEQAGNEIPIKEKVEVCFYLPTILKSEDKEKKSISSVRSNFSIVMYFINKTLRHNNRQIIIYVSMSIVFLIAAYFLRNIAVTGLLFSIVLEGLFIGGWFLLWEAFSIFIFESHLIRIRKKVFKRYLESDIYFKDDQSY